MPSGISLAGIAIGGLLSTVVSSIMQGGSDSQKAQIGAAPAVTPPTPMPTPGDQSSTIAKNASIAEQRRRQGRASTILTDPLSGDSAVSSQSTTLGG